MMGILLLLSCAAPSDLTVLAASSLTDAFTELSSEFSAAHPEARVTLSFGGSQVLGAQIRRGLSADIFASADPDLVSALVSEGHLSSAEVFAHNALVVAVPESSPITVLSDLPQASRLVLGVPESPVGAYTDTLLSSLGVLYGDSWAADVQSSVVSREPNVRLVLSKVLLGEADAAVVYASDVLGRPGLRAIAVPAERSPSVVYLQGAVGGGLASSWHAMVTGPSGRAVLSASGFLVAEP